MSDLLADPAFVSRLDRLDVLSRKILGGKLRGERLGRRRGDSMEPSDFRDYAAGDDPRFVDWNILARLDRLLIKLFRAEEEVFLHIMLDASASMDFGRPNKWEYLRQVAAALGYVGLCNGHHVRVWAVANEPARQSDLLHGRSAARRLIRFIDGLRPEGETRFAATCRRLTLRRDHRGICVVLSDFLFDDGLEQGLRMLAAAGHELFCVQALSPQETEPVQQGELQLADSENLTEATVRITARDIAEYKNRLNDLSRRAQACVESRGGRFLSAQTSVPFELLVLEGMRRGRLVG